METLVNGLAVGGQLVMLAIAEGITIPISTSPSLPSLSDTNNFNSPHGHEASFHQGMAFRYRPRLRRLRSSPPSLALLLILNAPFSSQVNFAKLSGVECQIEKFPLSKVNEAYQHMISGDVRFRAVLIM